MSELTYRERIEALRRTKMEHTLIKIQRMKEAGATGSMDSDDNGSVPLPHGREYHIIANHPCGDAFGLRANARSYRAVLESHPTYIDPMNALAGAWMVQYWTLGRVDCNPDLDFSWLHADQKRYGLLHGIGGPHHMCPDLTIGLELGWGGLLARLRHYRPLNPDRAEFYEAEEDVILGTQDLIRRNALAARGAAEVEPRPELRRTLLRMALANERLVSEPPRTFLEAVQWVSWFQMITRMYNSDGATGQIDVLLWPYYERDLAAGLITEEDALWIIACFLVQDTHYFQLGGPDEQGNDLTNRLSFLFLEAAHLLKIPANMAVRVHDKLDPAFFRKAVEYCFDDKNGNPNWMGDKGLNEGFVRSGYPIELARRRVKSGCHWCAIPGDEYPMNDIIKVNLANVFDVALREMLGDRAEPSTTDLWQRFAHHLQRAVRVIAEGIDFHLAHQEDVHPEIVINLFMHGTIEKGHDVSHPGTCKYYDICVDGVALATVADSFAAVEQRVEREHRLSWSELLQLLDTDFAGAEPQRLMLASVPRYGSGGSRADGYAVRISRLFAGLVAGSPTPGGIKMIPGLFSWASTIPMGKTVGATPNGRHAHAPISHGANPAPGFYQGHGHGAPTALARAVASVECGYGNTAPLQLDMDPGVGRDEGGLEVIAALIRTHVAQGGTMINLNVLNKEQVLAAHEDPSLYPDLVVRVTGFSAYFATLSKEFRQLVVDRLLAE
jgi:pyruvate-formate lyase